VTEATLIWYQAGQKVVYLHRTAAIKLAFDVERLSGFSEQARESDISVAYQGNPGQLGLTASKYAAQYVVMKRSGDRLAGIDLPASGLVPRGDGRGIGRLTTTNHYEFLAMGPGDRTSFQVWSPTARDAELELRVKRRGRGPTTPGMLMVNGQEMPVADAELPRDDWASVRRSVRLQEGWNEVEIRAAQQLEVLRFTGYNLVFSDLPSELREAYSDTYYVVLSRDPGASASMGQRRS
jgi:hypothetical protein